MQLMTVKAYAAKMASSESTIRRLCKQHILPSVKIGVGWKIDVEAADEYFRMQISSRPAPARQIKKSTGESFLEMVDKARKDLLRGY